MSDLLHVVAIGASAGGFQAVRTLASALGRDFPAAVLVVIHTMPQVSSNRAELLGKASVLPTAHAEEGDKLRPGHIYIAPPDRHLVVADGHLLVRRGPLENNSRPAIDPLFRSVAVDYGPRAIGIILSGFASQDGVSGLQAIKRCGGISIVQDPDDAEHDGMPEQAIARGSPDHVVAVRDMPELLRRLIARPKGPTPKVPPEIALEVRIAVQDDREMTTPDRLGTRSLLTCPTCHGILWEIDDGELVRYRCHVGHAFSGLDLDNAQMSEMERALSAALRALNERIALMSRLAEQARKRQQVHNARTWDARTNEYKKQAEAIRNLLLNRASDVAGDPAAQA